MTEGRREETGKERRKQIEKYIIKKERRNDRTV